MSEWVSTAIAAARLGVSERTILRRAQTGKLESRKETTARGVVVMVSLESQEVPTSADIVRTGADTQTTLKTTAIAVEVPTGADGADTNFTTHLLEENRFLRATIEQLQRDSAETRAALREALKAMPKALTSGAALPSPEAPIRADNCADEQTRGAVENGAQTPQESNDEVDLDEITAMIYRTFK